MRRAKESLTVFQRVKNLHLEDAIQIGPGSLSQLMKYLAGKVPRARKADPAVRMFVAETIAKLINRSGDRTMTRKLGDLVLRAPSPEEGAGAARAIGFLDRSSLSGGGREILERRGLPHRHILVAIASAEALGRVGSKDSTLHLAEVAKAADLSSKTGILLAGTAVRSIGRIGEADEKAREILGRMIGHEGPAGEKTDKANEPTIREYAADALGLVGDTESILWPLRARRDIALNVRGAAAAAIPALYQRHPDVRDTAEVVLVDMERKSDDRLGASLSLGDMGDPLSSNRLIYSVVDENAPHLIKDFSSSVRSAGCRSLGRIRSRYVSVVGGLITALKDDSKDVQRDAYAALKAILGPEVCAEVSIMVTLVDADGVSRQEESEFRPGLPLYSDHLMLLRKWYLWLKENKSSLDPDD